jgi:hypothetical protein
MYQFSTILHGYVRKSGRLKDCGASTDEEEGSYPMINAALDHGGSKLERLGSDSSTI